MAIPHHIAEVHWSRQGAAFTDNRYSRAHTWRFDGGAEVHASSSPHVVPLPMSDPAGVDPEEAFIASLSSCHMLWFLAIAAKRGFVVESYDDEAEGTMGTSDSGKLAMTRVILRPRAEFAGPRIPTSPDLDAMHHEAHDKCFIAASVHTEVLVEPA
jgi:organic hydroperoxide reductase OsmC/OhrA